MRWLERQIESECMKLERLDVRIYICGIIAISIKAMLSFSELFAFVPSIVHTALGAIFLLCMGYKLLCQRYTKSMLVSIILLGAVCLYTYLGRVSYYYLLCSFLCIAAIQDVDLKKLLKATSTFKIGCICLHVVCYWFVYFIMPWKIHFYYRAGSGAPRHSFLIGHANTFTMYMTWTSLEFIYAYYDVLTIPRLLLIYLLNIISYLFTDSNTGMIVMTFTTFFIICDKLNIQKVKKLYHVIARWGFIFCTFFFSLITIIYSKMSGPFLPFCNFLNKIFTGRLLYGAVSYDLRGWTFWGQEVNFPEKMYWKGYWFDGIGCDNTYVWFFVSYGFAYMLLLGIAYACLANRFSEIEKIVLVSYIFYGMMEAYIINAVFCFPLLLIGKYMYQLETVRKGSGKVKCPMKE